MTPATVHQANSSALPFAAWSCCPFPAASIAHPGQLNDVAADWFPAIVPGTVAAALRASGQWNIDQPLDADEKDWWYRTSFAAHALPSSQRCFLCLDGLATLAEVWLNGRCVLMTDNMFRSYRVDIAPFLEECNQLAIVFRSLTNELSKARPRPRWKTNLVKHQQLRWHRATLLGRIPGWSPVVPTIGPWRAIRLDIEPVSLSQFQLTATLRENVGQVTLSARVDSALKLERASFCVGDQEIVAEIKANSDSWLLAATLSIPNPPLWWPHTHGRQDLLSTGLTIHAGGKVHTFVGGKVGFRQLEVQEEKGFSLLVNGIPIYCRGACWTISDMVTLDGATDSLEHDLRLARDAGMNMLRVGGTMIYESDKFYQLCDELGILVWQDFMFANMDYPVEDEAFAANITAEARHQLSRLSGHPCVALYCGNSEVEQQAAMLGVSRHLWRNDWFADRLPALCAELHPGAGYVPSTPSGGAMPFHVRSGITHYYGVGAYMRSPMEVRRADVKFTSECLGFANVPDPHTVNAVMHDSLPVMHHPRWKQRVPRDTGAGWDFEDIRDFYLKQFFGVDPFPLRSFDVGRYLALSRVVTGEVMAQVCAEWRSGYSNNHGALVWFFKDLWPGAGWGVVDSSGVPKAAYYYLRRGWQPRQITITDEGLDGIHLHVINERDEPLSGFVELLLLKDSHVIVARQEVPCQLSSRSIQTLESDALLDRFYDVSYAYRFGPPKHDVVVATLYDDNHQVLSEAYHFMTQHEPAFLSECKLEATADLADDGTCQVTLRSDRFLQSVSFDVDGFLPNDNYFHLCPLREKRVLFTSVKKPGGALKGYIEALNLRTPVKISTKAPRGTAPESV